MSNVVYLSRDLYPGQGAYMPEGLETELLTPPVNREDTGGRSMLGAALISFAVLCAFGGLIYVLLPKIG